MIPPEAADTSMDQAQLADLILVVGSTGEVMPAAMLPRLVKRNGGRVIEVNPEPSNYTGEVTDCFLQGKAGDMLSRLVQARFGLGSPFWGMSYPLVPTVLRGNAKPNRANAKMISWLPCSAWEPFLRQGIAIPNVIFRCHCEGVPRRGTTAAISTRMATLHSIKLAKAGIATSLRASQ